MYSPKILVVEDEKILAVDIRKKLQKLGYPVPEITDCGEEALKKVAEINPNLVLIDIGLAGKMNGVQVADAIADNFQVPVLYLTDSEVTNLPKNRFREPFSYILKPFAERDLHIAIEMALYNHQTKRKLQEEKQNFIAIVKSMGSAVVVTDANGCIQIINPVAEALTAWNQDEAAAKDLAEVMSLVDKDTGKAIKDLATQAMHMGVAISIPENSTLIAKDGTKIQIEGSVAPIRNGAKITGAVLVFQDITQRKQTEAQLVRNAFYDALTAIPNRVLFQDRLSQVFERGKRQKNYRFAILFLDLDGFKGINDRFGHGMGDNLLIEIARRLELCLRSGDTVARFGGDEFAVLLEDIKDLREATNVANRIQETLRLPLDLNGHQILITASIGIALSCSSYVEPESILRDADIAMYRAKKQGKARYAVFNFQDSAPRFHSKLSIQNSKLITP